MSVYYIRTHLLKLNGTPDTETIRLYYESAFAGEIRKQWEKEKSGNKDWFAVVTADLVAHLPNGHTLLEIKLGTTTDSKFFGMADFVAVTERVDAVIRNNLDVIEGDGEIEWVSAKVSRPAKDVNIEHIINQKFSDE